MVIGRRNPHRVSFGSWPERGVVVRGGAAVENAPMRRHLAVLASLLLVLAACGSDDGGGGTTTSSGGSTRTVLVDYNHDEIAASFLENYPRNVTLTPGDTVVFKQAWTGEPHTVTFGTHIDNVAKLHPNAIKYFKEGGGEPELPPEIDKQADEAFEKIPFAFGEDNLTQNAGQPCYLDSGMPPEDPNQPCAKREQPAFNGRQTYYSSGIIPYQGEDGNRFEVPLADDIAPGDYTYYCAVHGPGQSGVITVKPKGSEIPTQSAVDRQARREIERTAAPLIEAKEAAEDGRFAIQDKKIEGNLAGFAAMKDPFSVHAFGSEFLPATITTRVGQKVKWTVIANHTISFDVPRYLPILTFAKDGRVELNPRIAKPQGGWPGAPEEEGPPEGEGAPPEGEGAPPEGEGGPPEGEEGGPPEQYEVPTKEIDAGHWDGSGFVSSGAIADVIYSVTFDKPGRYKYACLIHPRMVGEVVVR